MYKCDLTMQRLGNYAYSLLTWPPTLTTFLCATHKPCFGCRAKSINTSKRPPPHRGPESEGYLMSWTPLTQPFDLYFFFLIAILNPLLYILLWVTKPSWCNLCACGMLSNLHSGQRVEWVEQWSRPCCQHQCQLGGTLVELLVPSSWQGDILHSDTHDSA